MGRYKRDDGEGGVHNCVTSFMEDPLAILAAVNLLNTLHVKLVISASQSWLILRIVLLFNGRPTTRSRAARRLRFTSRPLLRERLGDRAVSAATLPDRSSAATKDLRQTEQPTADTWVIAVEDIIPGNLKPISCFWNPMQFLFQWFFFPYCHTSFAALINRCNNNNNNNNNFYSFK